jgi:RHS repeat-associated protein
VALTDKHGHPVRHYRYSTFGVPEDHKGDPQPYRFTGREWDKEVGLYYYRTRYYDPHSGRFLREDPLKGILRFPNTLNPYPYALGNPLIHADPSGMAPPAIAIAIAGGMIAGAINAAVKGEGLTGIASQAIMGGVAGLVGFNLASKAITSALAGGTVGAITDILGQIAANLARNGPVTDIDISSVIRSFIAGAAGAGIGTYAKTLGLTEADAQKVAAALGAVLSSSGNLLQRIIEAAEAATFCPLAP